jgi:hypothetical protein
MLMALALMVVAAMALSGVAQAKSISQQPGDSSPNALCAKLAIQTLGKGFKPANYTFFGGTAGNDNFDNKGTAGADVFCGFGGNDSRGTLDAADIFNGGDGIDSVGGDNPGTFNGGAGDDSVSYNYGTFNGGDGIDTVDNGNPP